jgi:hypothetical protein
MITTISPKLLRRLKRYNDVNIIMLKALVFNVNNSLFSACFTWASKEFWICSHIQENLILDQLYVVLKEYSTTYDISLITARKKPYKAEY